MSFIEIIRKVPTYPTFVTLKQIQKVTNHWVIDEIQKLNLYCIAVLTLERQFTEDNK